jgi:SAM-dependent methyltransferase
LPKISIFTPSNNSSFLHEVYASIKDQDFFEWMILFNHEGEPIDFGDPRVKGMVVYGLPENVGALKAAACERCTGDILLELDHDDLFCPTAIEEVNQAFADESVGFVYSNCIRVMGDLSKVPEAGRINPHYGWQYRDTEFRGQPVEELISFEPSPEMVSRVWFAPDHLRAFRRSVYLEVGGYDRSMKVLDDSDLMCRMYQVTKFHHIDKPLYVYRIHGENAWLKHNQEIQNGVWPLYEKYIDALVDRACALRGLENVVLTATDQLANYADSSVGVIRAIDQFQRYSDSLTIMREVYRVLAPGGWVLTTVPSTDGRGAFQSPGVKSYWNVNSFKYYTEARLAQYIGTPARFQAVRLYDTEKDVDGVIWTRAHLLSLKGGYKPCGLVAI